MTRDEFWTRAFCASLTGHRANSHDDTGLCSSYQETIGWAAMDANEAVRVAADVIAFDPAPDPRVTVPTMVGLDQFRDWTLKALVAHGKRIETVERFASEHTDYHRNMSAHPE